MILFSGFFAAPSSTWRKAFGLLCLLHLNGFGQAGSRGIYTPNPSYPHLELGNVFLFGLLCPSRPRQVISGGIKTHYGWGINKSSLWFPLSIKIRYLWPVRSDFRPTNYEGGSVISLCIPKQKENPTTCSVLLFSDAPFPVVWPLNPPSILKYPYLCASVANWGLSGSNCIFQQLASRANFNNWMENNTKSEGQTGSRNWHSHGNCQSTLTAKINWELIKWEQ